MLNGGLTDMKNMLMGISFLLIMLVVPIQEFWVRLILLTIVGTCIGKGYRDMTDEEEKEEEED
jgi:hypothetical protein